MADTMQITQFLHYSHATFQRIQRKMAAGRCMGQFLHFCRVFENSINLLFGTSAVQLAWWVVGYESDFF